MTKIEDMSEVERQSWITVLADGAVLAYFWSHMTGGFSLRPVYTDIKDMSSVIISVIAVTIVLHIIISSIFEARKRQETFEKDERDDEIERLGAHWGYRLIQFGIGSVIVIMLMHNGVALDHPAARDFGTPIQVLFLLIVISYLADLVKHGRMIMAYRGA